MQIGVPKTNRLFNACRTILGLSSFVVFALLFQYGVRSVEAATPPAVITYQGKLASNGLLATTTQSMVLTIYDASNGGNVLYTASGTTSTPAALGITPVNGIFTVNLGGQGTNALSPTIFRDHQDLYLEVSVGGQTLSPRKQLTSAPFAINSEYLGGVAGSSVALLSQYIPVSDTNGDFAFNGVSVSSTLRVYSTSTLATTTISGRLGVGTSSPSSALAIQDTKPVITLNDSSLGGKTYQIRNGVVPGKLDFYSNEIGKSLLTVQSDQVMVGTSSNNILGNSSRFFVYGGNNGANIDVMGDGNIIGGDQAVIELEGSDWDQHGNSVMLRFMGINAIGSNPMGFSNRNLGSLSFNQAEKALIYTDNTSSLMFGTNFTERMRIDGVSGYLGIGTTSPQSMLHVEGPNNLASWSSVAQFNAGDTSGAIGGAIVSIQASTASGRYDGARLYGGKWYDNSGLRIAPVPWNNVPFGFETFYLDIGTDVDGNNNAFKFLGGNVGIGTTTPQTALSVSGTSTLEYAVISTSTIKSLSVSGMSTLSNVTISTGTASNLSVNTLSVSGALGLGTSTPAALLHLKALSSGQNPFLISSSTGSVFSVLADNHVVVGGVTSSAYLSVLPSASAPLAFVTSTDLEVSPRSIALSGKFAFVVGPVENVLSVIDLSVPRAPVVISTTTIGSGAQRIIVSGDFAYIAGSNEIYNISNPTTPVKVGNIAVSLAGVNDIALSGNYAFLISNAPNSMKVVDISNPYNPTSTASVSVGAEPRGIVISGRYAYIASYLDNSINIVDIVNPSAPVLISSSTVGVHPMGLAVSGHYVYVANGDSGTISVVDVKNPLLPVQVNTIATSDRPHKITIVGRYAFVAHIFDPAIFVLDLLNPSAPTVVQQIEIPGSNGYIYDVSASGRFVYAADYLRKKFAVIDVGGVETNALSTGALEVGNLSVQSYINGSYLALSGGLSVGTGGINSIGQVSGFVSSTVFNSNLAAGNFAAGSTSTVVIMNKLGSDGTFVSLRRDGVEQGSVTVSGGTVSYNAFTGSHYALLPSGVTDMQQGYLMSMTGLNNRLHNDQNSELLYGVDRSTTANDSRILGTYLSLQSPGSQGVDNPHLIAAVGNGDMWVADNGSNVAIGDYLISSQVAGHAMKDDGSYDVSYVIARAAEPIDWSQVTETAGGVKHAKISVLYENFVKDNRVDKMLSFSSSTNLMVFGKATQPANIQLSNLLRFTDSEKGTISFAGTGNFDSDAVGSGKAFTFNALNFAGPNGVVASFASQGVPVLNIKANGDLSTNGTIQAGQFMTGTSTLDLAETYPIDQDCSVRGNCPEAGDAVCLVEGKIATIEKCALPYSEKAIGIISTRPGFTLGDAKDAGQRKVALAGRVPVKVSLKNGTIAVGDRLTTSDVPGEVMKATGSGPTLGVALEDYSGSEGGTVLAFVKMGWWSPVNVVGPTMPQAVTVETIAAEVMKVLKAVGVTIENGILTAKEFIADKITSGEVETQKLCVEGVCITKDQFKDLLDKNNIAPAGVTEASTPALSMPIVTSSTVNETEVLTSTPEIIDSEVQIVSTTPDALIEQLVPITDPVVVDSPSTTASTETVIATVSTEAVQ